MHEVTNIIAKEINVKKKFGDRSNVSLVSMFSVNYNCVNKIINKWLNYTAVCPYDSIQSSHQLSLIFFRRRIVATTKTFN